MPIPKPESGESLKDFAKRAMADDVMQREYPSLKQRYAVIASVYKRHAANAKKLAATKARQRLE